MFFKKVAPKTKNFFARCFAKAYIIAEVKRKFHQDKVKSRDSIQSFMADVDSLLLTEDAEKEEGGNECCVFQRSDDKVLVFTEELCDLLYNYITDEIVAEPLRRRTRRRVSIPANRAE